jgi:hypothetical protein
LQTHIITLPDTIQDSIIWMSVEAWDRLIAQEEIVAKQVELIADDYEKQAIPSRNWHMYD